MPLIAVLLFPAPAAGSVPGESSDSPALNQYVEQVPTPRGDRATNGGPGRGSLPPAAERKVDRQAGADAEALKGIATSEALGAPERAGRNARERKARERNAPSAGTGAPSALGAARDAAGGTGVGLLAIALLAMAAVAVAVAVARRRAQPG